MADAKDLKSFVRLRTCGFESRLGHCFSRRITQFLNECDGNEMYSKGQERRLILLRLAAT